MKKTLLKLTFVSLISSTILTSCNNNHSMNDSMKKDHTHNSEEVNNTQNEVYACPMHPEITGEKGGKCSKCGMDLEIKE